MEWEIVRSGVAGLAVLASFGLFVLLAKIAGELLDREESK